MIDDEYIVKALVQTGRLNLEQLRDLSAWARGAGQSLSVAAVQNGFVTEEVLVTELSRVLRMTPVSLAQFQPKPTLISALPLQVVERLRALPVGLKPKDGKIHLFVAMEDPTDMDALEELATHAAHPVVPLLAGPLDLDSAIRRMLSLARPSNSIALPGIPVRPTSSPMPAPAVAQPPPTASPAEPAFGRRDPSDIFANVIDEMPDRPADMLSALSLLDDIPRNRHELDTSPTGYNTIGEARKSSGGELPVIMPEPDNGNSVTGLTGAGAPVDAPKSRSRLGIEPKPPRRGENAFDSQLGSQFGSATGFGMPASELGTRPRTSTERGWADVPTDDLVKGVVRLLIERGYLTEAELVAALKKRT